MKMSTYNPSWKSVILESSVKPSNDNLMLNICLELVMLMKMSTYNPSWNQTRFG